MQFVPLAKDSWDLPRDVDIFLVLIGLMRWIGRASCILSCPTADILRLLILVSTFCLLLGVTLRHRHALHHHVLLLGVVVLGGSWLCAALTPC